MRHKLYQNAMITYTAIFFFALYLLTVSIYQKASAAPLDASKNVQRVPDEYESTAGHSLGFANSGVAAVGGLSAVKMNPAMLPMEKHYRISGGYHWPSVGREYYQGGIVDSTSSSLAAGIVYTSSQDGYQKLSRSPTQTTDILANDETYQQAHDTPIKKRLSLGVGRVFGSFSLGIGAQQIEAWDINNPNGAKMIRGRTVGVGVAGLITKAIRFGASVENLANDRIKSYAPRIYRAGVAMILRGGDFTAHLDYRDRARVAQELQTNSSRFPDILLGQPEVRSQRRTNSVQPSEKMLTASASVKIQNMMRLLGAYSHELGSRKRKIVAGGIAIVSNKMTFSYLVSNPYIATDQRIHHAMNLGVEVAL